MPLSQATLASFLDNELLRVRARLIAARDQMNEDIAAVEREMEERELRRAARTPKAANIEMKPKRALPGLTSGLS